MTIEMLLDYIGSLDSETAEQIIERLKQAEADGLKMINEAKPNDAALQLRYYEALSKMADGQATKIFLPSDFSKAGALSSVFKEVNKDK